MVRAALEGPISLNGSWPEFPGGGVYDGRCHEIESIENDRGELKKKMESFNSLEAFKALIQETINAWIAKFKDMEEVYVAENVGGDCEVDTESRYGDDPEFNRMCPHIPRGCWLRGLWSTHSVAQRENEGL